MRLRKSRTTLNRWRFELMRGSNSSGNRHVSLETVGVMRWAVHSFHSFTNFTSHRVLEAAQLPICAPTQLPSALSSVRPSDSALVGTLHNHRHTRVDGALLPHSRIAVSKASLEPDERGGIGRPKSGSRRLISTKVQRTYLGPGSPPSSRPVCFYCSSIRQKARGKVRERDHCEPPGSASGS